jgi:hypothetical protein
MEPNHVQYVDVVAGDESVISGVVEQYNRIYKTDFEITTFEERNHVLFAVIKFSKARLFDVFQLGSLFGMHVQSKRDSKEIDW